MTTFPTVRASQRMTMTLLYIHEHLMTLKYVDCPRKALPFMMNLWLKAQQGDFHLDHVKYVAAQHILRKNTKLWKKALE